MEDTALVYSNILFVLAWFILMFERFVENVPVPPLLLILTGLVPLTSIVYHQLEIKEKDRQKSISGSDPIPIDVGAALTVCHCDMATVVFTGGFVIYLIIEHHFPKAFLLLFALALIPWYVARNATNWLVYVDVHSLWHVVAGLVLLLILKQLILDSEYIRFEMSIH